VFTLDRSAAPPPWITGAFALLLLAVATWPSVAETTVEYDFFLVEAFDPNYDLREVILRDINESAMVTGTATRNGFYAGFVWTEPTDKVIIPMIWPQGINNLNQIVSDGRIYDFDSGATTSVPPAGAWPVPRLQAINDNGIAVGFSECACSNSDRTLQDALVWDAQGGSRTIAVPYAKELLRINNANVAVGNIRGGTSAGTEGFVYDVDTGAHVRISDFMPPYLNGRAPSELTDVSETGVVTGRGWDGDVRRGVTWSEADGITFLPAIPGGLLDRVFPQGINAAGTVVGFADRTLHNPRAFVWNAQNGMRNLNDLVSAPPNFILDWAIKVNDRGWIIGIGHYGPGWGTSRGFVLRPIGETAGAGEAALAPAVAELSVLRNPVADRLVARIAVPGGGPARLSVFDVAGREVARMLDEEISAGEHTVTWSPSATQPAGVYYIRLTAAGGHRSERFVLLH